MRRIALRPLALILFALSLSPCSAQDWTVGTPVDFHMTSIGVYGGCYPNTDQTLNIPQCTTTGVQYIAVVNSAYPGGAISITPGISNIYNGDTLHITSTVPRDVTFPQGGGQLFLDLYAVGTPTVPGEAHTCVFNQFWISNLGICPESLYFSPEMNCLVQSSTSVLDPASTDGRFTLPSLENGQQLSFTGTTGEGGFLLTDACGRSLVQDGLGELVNGLDLSTMPAGLYIIAIRSSESAPRSVRFVINGN